MKKVLLLTLVAFLGFNVNAQQKQSENTVKIGFKAGVNLPEFNVSGSESGEFNPKFNTSFYVGGIIDLQVGRTFTFQPGLILGGKGVKFENSGSGYSSSDKISLMYLEVPVNFVANFAAGSGKFFVGAGPYYSLAISGKIKSDASFTNGGITVSESSNEDVKFGKNEDDDLKRGDFGLNFLAGYGLKNGLNLHAGYGLGLRSISNEDSSLIKFRNNVISIGLGYTF